MGVSGDGSVALGHRSHDSEMLDPARQVGQPCGDPVLTLGLAADAPILPAADRGADGRLEPDVAACHVADDIVGEVAAHAAVKKVADADHLVVAVSADGLGDHARGEHPDVHAAAVARWADS